jgi:hypothetical protein
MDEIGQQSHVADEFDFDGVLPDTLKGGDERHNLYHYINDR